MGKIRSINVSRRKGGPKHPVRRGRLVALHGIEGDGHAGPGERQVSLLSWERARKLRDEGAPVGYGSFGENITTSGIDLSRLAVGDRLRLGGRGVVEVTAVGKVCRRPCRIFRQVGRCIMPQEGVFCRVIAGAVLRTGDPLVRIPSRKGEGAMRKLSVGVVVVSDSASAGLRKDECAEAIGKELPAGKARIVASVIVPDEIRAIRAAVRAMTDGERLDLVIAAGGTGVGPRDVTPEALQPLIRKQIPGLPELMRARGARIKPEAILSRAIAGTRAASLIVALPGSPRGAAESLAWIWPAIPHAIECARGEARECAGKRGFKSQTPNPKSQRKKKG